MCRRGRARIAIWLVTILLVAFLSQTTSAAVNTQARGTLYTELLYTPEDLLMFGNRAQLNIDIEAREGNARGKIILGGVWQSLTPFWKDNHGGGPGGNLANFEQSYVEYEGPVYLSGPSVKLAAGHMFILGYPAYAARIDAHSNPGGWTNGVRRAVRLENLRFSLPLGGRDVSVDNKAFIVWEKDKPDAYGIGYSAQASMGQWSSVLTIVDFEERERLDIGGEAGYYGAPLDKDTVIGMELRGPIASKATLDLMAATHLDGKRSATDETVLETERSMIIDASVRYAPSSRTAYRLGVRGFEPGFDPQYRDRAEDNLVDKHRDRRGIYGEAETVVGAFDGKDVKLTLSAGQFQTYADDPDLIQELGLSAETELGGFGLKASVDTTQKTPATGAATQETTTTLSAEGTLLRQRGFLLQGSAVVTRETGADPLTKWEVGLTHTLRAGSLRNMQLKGGLIAEVRDTTETRVYLGLSYRLPLGLQLDAKWTTPNNVNDPDDDLDNFVRLSHTINF